MRTIIYTKEMQQQKLLKFIEQLCNCSIEELTTTSTNNIPTHEEETLNMLTKKYNCNINDIKIEKTEFIYLYYLDNKCIYAD